MKLIINGFLGAIGFEIRRTGTPTRSMHRGLTELAKHIRVEGVIDIGVAEGTPELYDVFPASRHKYLLVEADPYYKERILELAVELGRWCSLARHHLP